MHTHTKVCWKEISFCVCLVSELKTGISGSRHLISCSDNLAIYAADCSIKHFTHSFIVKPACGSSWSWKPCVWVSGSREHCIIITDPEESRPTLDSLCETHTHTHGQFKLGDTFVHGLSSLHPPLPTDESISKLYLKFSLDTQSFTRGLSTG